MTRGKYAAKTEAARVREDAIARAAAAETALARLQKQLESTVADFETKLETLRNRNNRLLDQLDHNTSEALEREIARADERAAKVRELQAVEIERQKKYDAFFVAMVSHFESNHRMNGQEAVSAFIALCEQRQVVLYSGDEKIGARSPGFHDHITRLYARNMAIRMGEEWDNLSAHPKSATTAESDSEQAEQ